MENVIESGMVRCAEQNTEQNTDNSHSNQEQNTDGNHSNQEVCRCCYILLKTHFLQCSKQKKKRSYRCKTCGGKFKNKEELTNHKREKHPGDWKQERLKKVPKVLLENDDENDDDDDGTGTCEAFINNSACTSERPRNQLNGTSEGAPGNFFLQSVMMNQVDETIHLSMSEETVAPEPEVDHKVYECDICSSFFANYDVYMKHVEKHKEDETLGGEQDEDSDDDNWSVKEQKEETPVCRCSKCGETFKHEHLYDNHVITCGNKELKCSDCGRKFRNKTELIVHVKRKHVTHDCPYCGKKCGHKSRLRDHLPVHTGVRAFQCVNCKNSFKRKCNLTKHARICTGGKRVKCGECGASYNLRWTLMQHLRTHLIPPRQCEACSEWFRCVIFLRVPFLPMLP